MTNAAYARAIAGYQAVGALARSPREIALMLHQRLYALIQAARSADEQNRLDVMVARLEEASRILGAMKIGMDFKSVGPSGEELAGLYARLHRQVRRIGMLPKGNRDWSVISDPIQNMITHIIADANRNK